MSDQAAQEPTTDPIPETPEGSAPDPQQDGGTPPPWGDDFDAQRAWNTITHLRGREHELEQAARELEQFLTSPEAMISALEALGYEFETEPDEDPEPVEFDDPRDAKLHELEQWKASIEQERARQREAEQAATEQAYLDKIEADCNAQLAAIDGLDDDDRDWIFTRALTTHHTPEGLPDIEAAHKEFVERENARQRRWAESKTAPHTPGSGTSATQVPDLDDEAQRHAYMRERLRAANAD